MKTIKIAFLLLFIIATSSLSAQDKTYGEKHGGTLNLGLGIGYYGYLDNNMPVLHANYEFDVAKNFTLAPFITIYSYKSYTYWGDSNHPEREYYYRQTAIPIGVKGTYYFDQLLQASPKWDFYLSGSLGYVIRTTTWENNYYGSKTIKSNGNLYLDVHVGTEYHFNNNIGMFLDLSSGTSTIGLAIH